jgi:DNA-binding LacI/PurR family transcriptional regulator
MASMKDVAKKAGVSISTVSHVLNGTKYVSDEIKRKVNVTVKELGYEVDAVARSMKSSQTMKIGIITDDMCGLFYPYIIKAICEVAEKSGYSTIICDTSSNIEKEKKSFRDLVSSRVDGIIISSSIPNEFVREYARELKTMVSQKKKQIALVSIERDFSEFGIDSIYTNMEDGGKKATQYLIDLGCKTIGHITGPIVASVAQDRIHGYEKALLDNGMQINEDLISFGDYSHLSGYIRMKELLQRVPHLDGVFVANDQMAIGACISLKELGKSIPNDIKVIGFDDVFVSSIVEPPLSTIHIKKKHLGREAINALLEQIENGPREKALCIELENHLVIRKSTDSSAPPDWILSDW